MGPEERRTSAARVWFDDEGILNVVSLGVESTEQTGREFLAVKRELVGSRRVALLLDARDWPRGNPASWKQFISVLESICYAGAVIASPKSIKAMGVFPQVFDDLLIPFRVFETEEQARDFLRRHLED